MKIRFYQVALHIIQGISIPLSCFRSGWYFDYKSFTKDYPGIEVFDPCKYYEAGDTCYRFYEWVEQEDVDGLDVDVTYVKFELLTCTTSGEGRTVSFTVVPKPEYLKDLDEGLVDLLHPWLDSLKGKLRLVSIMDSNLSDIESIIQGFLRDPSSSFFKDKRKRVIIYDWMGALLSTKGDVWKNSREAYDFIKAIQTTYEALSLMIEGIANEEKTQKAWFNPAEIFPKDNRSSKYVIKESHLMVRSEQYEDATRCVRMIIQKAASKQSGASTEVYLRNDIHYSAMERITQEEHKALNPDFWEDRKDSKDKAENTYTKGNYSKDKQANADMDVLAQMDKF